MLRRIEAGGEWIALDYDSFHRVASARDSAGHGMSYSYAVAGRLREARSSDGATRRYGDDGADRLTRIEDPERVIENVYADGRTFGPARRSQSRTPVAMASAAGPRVDPLRLGIQESLVPSV
jgi:YD repeat-containing protein